MKGPSFNWFESYPENRQLFIKTNASASKQPTFLCGLSEGNKLGQSLF